MPRKIATFFSLEPLDRGTNLALLILRLLVGGFLVWGVWDNIASAKWMAEFEAYLADFGFPAPKLSAAITVYAQFAAGIALMLGLLTRWAALICMVNFVVAVVMVDRLGGMRAIFPSAALVAIGLLFLTGGPGRFSLDRLLFRPVT